jgi:hypothetical protein
MNRLARLAATLALLALAPGCIATTHMSPDPGPRHFNEIKWAASYDAAKQEATTSGKPILLIVAAGARNGFC